MPTTSPHYPNIIQKIAGNTSYSPKNPWPLPMLSATMDQMLTDLLTELFERYRGPLPRLAYVTEGELLLQYLVSVLQAPQNTLSLVMNY